MTRINRLTGISAIISFILVILPSPGLGNQPEYRLQGNTQIDNRTGQLVSVFNPDQERRAGRPEEAARDLLQAMSSTLGLKADLADLHVRKIAQSQTGVHVTYEQKYGDIPVHNGYIIINLNHRNTVRSISNHYKQSVSPDLLIPLISANGAKGIAWSESEKPSFISGESVTLCIFRDPANAIDRLAWKTLGFHDGRLSVLFISAASGDVLNSIQVTSASTAAAKVFNPDPRTTLADNTLFDSVTQGVEDEDYPPIQPLAYSSVTLLDLDDPSPSSGDYAIQGLYSLSANLPAYTGYTPVSPDILPVTSSVPNFEFNRDQDGFEEAVVYFHIDTFQKYLQSLGINNLSAPIEFDAHNMYERNAFYIHPQVSGPLSDTIVFGEGGVPQDPGVDMAEDPSVVVHEYTHALQFEILPEWNDGGSDVDMNRMAEGYADYVAISYRRSTESGSIFNQDQVAPWGLEANGISRSLDHGFRYPTDNFNGPFPHYPGGVLWASTLIAMEEAIGDRDIANFLVFESMRSLGPLSTMVDAANAMISVDLDEFGGVHAGQVVAVFAERGFFPTRNGDADNQVWGNVLVNGDIDVSQGTSLTILPGSVVAVTANSDVTGLGQYPDKVELDLRGNIYAQGNSDQPILFTSDAATPLPGDWGGLEVRDASGTHTTYLSWAWVWYAVDGCLVRSDGTLNMGFSEIEYCSTGVSSIDWGDVVIDNSVFRHCDTGIHAGGLSSVAFQSGGIIDSCGTGVLVEDNASLQLGHTYQTSGDPYTVVLKDCYEVGVEIHSDASNWIEQVLIEGTNDDHWVGIHTLPGSDVNIVRCEVRDAPGYIPVGIFIEGEATVLGPKISNISPPGVGQYGSGLGLASEAGVTVLVDKAGPLGPMWKHPVIVGCRNGIQVMGAAEPIIRNAEIANNAAGVDISPAAVPDLGLSEAGNNSITGSSRNSAGLEWPAADSRISLVFDAALGTHPTQGDQDGSSTISVGSFYIYAYSEDVLEIVPPDVVGDDVIGWESSILLADQNNSISSVVYPDNVGKLGFGLMESFRDPCLGKVHAEKSNDILISTGSQLRVSPGAPNPFRHQIQWELTSNEDRTVEITILKVTGQLVRRFQSTKLSTGSTTVTWDGNDEYGKKAPSGVYYLRVIGPAGYRVVRRAVLVR